MILINAEQADLPRLIQFRRDAAAWLSSEGIDQWSNPFPSAHIARSIEQGEVFIIRDGAAVAATVTLDRDADPRIWTSEEAAEPALYVHKLSVDRAYAGRDLGGAILNWASSQAAAAGARWLRLDAWTTNPRLQRYYIDHGFEHLRTVTGGDVVSGWVAQKAALPLPHDLVDQSIGVPPLTPSGMEGEKSQPL